MTTARVRAGLCLAAGLVALSGCNRAPIGRPPAFTPAQQGQEHLAMTAPPSAYMVDLPSTSPQVVNASLWTGDRGSLLGDRRAMQQGDILTVVIEIDDSAQISNSSDRSRSGSESLAIPQLFGLPQRIEPRLPDGAGLDPAVGLNSESSFTGDGSVRRNEKLELRVAATVIAVLPNGVLAIEGQQEVRVNFELRELVVTGYVRPADISRQNEVTYDKIASARISYGGRGQISDVQQPRYGQQVTDAILPF